MAIQITAPKLGVSTDPVLVVEWTAKEGERVEKGAAIVVIETEKIRHDIEAEAAGYVHVVVAAGVDVAIGGLIGIIAETKEEYDQQKKIPIGSIATQSELKEQVGRTARVTMITKTESVQSGRILISPIARKIAEEHGMDISRITGTGPGGKIVRKDIEREIEMPAKTAVEFTCLPQGKITESIGEKRVKTKINLTGMKKAIAEHMHRSLSVAAQLTVMGEIDASEIVNLRQKFVSEEKTLGVRVTYTDFVVYAIARALKRFPMVNASLIGNEIIQWEDINVAVAVATDDGLIVPVVKNADSKSVTEISQSIKMLAQKARERTLLPQEVQDGTFTITNLGALGGGYRFETVIINQPETGILGTGGITERAVVRNGQIVIRPIMTYYFTYDHRVIDGAMAAQFIAYITRLLENPSLLIA